MSVHVAIVHCPQPSGITVNGCVNARRCISEACLNSRSRLVSKSIELPIHLGVDHDTAGHSICQLGGNRRSVLKFTLTDSRGNTPQDAGIGCKRVLLLQQVDGRTLDLHTYN